MVVVVSDSVFSSSTKWLSAEGYFFSIFQQKTEKDAIIKA